MTVSRHNIEAWVGTQKIDIENASITMDESWSPYVQASLKTIADPAILSQLDPRTGNRVKLYVSQEYGDSDKLSLLTTTYTGKKISQLTTDWGSGGSPVLLATNLIPNPSFESNTTSWVTSGTFSRVTTESYVGSASASSIFTASGQSTSIRNLSINPSTSYTASAWVKGAAGGIVSLRLNERTAADASVGVTSSGNVTLTGSWQRLTVTRAMGATAGLAWVYIQSGSAGTITVYLDAVMLEQAATAGSYFDGNSGTGYSWNGTVNNSTSSHYSTPSTVSGFIYSISEYYFVPFNPSGSNKLSRLSSLYGGQKISALTTAWTTWYLYQISELYFRSYPDGIYNNYRRGFDLGIRARQVNLDDGTVDLELASDEALLQDYALVSANNFSPASLQLRDIVEEILARIGGYLVSGSTGGLVDATAALWAPGQTGWDYLNALVQEQKLRLYCDENRNWYLIDGTYTRPGLAELWSVGTIKAADENISRDDGLWFDAVVIKYTWTDALGATIIAYDTASVPNFTKVKLIERETAYPGAGAALSILNRALSQGRQLDVTTVSNYSVEPSMACDIYILGTPTEHTYIKAVSWNYPSDEMNVTTRLPVTV